MKSTKFIRDNLSGALISNDHESYYKAKLLKENRKKANSCDTTQLLIYIRALEKRIRKLEAKQNDNTN